MKLLLSFFYCLIFLPGISQDWSSYNKQSMDAYQKGHYDTAIFLADHALAIARDAYGSHSDQYMASLSNKAYAQSGLGNYRQSLENFKVVANTSFSLYPLPHVSQMESLHELAKAFMTLGIYDSSTHYLNLARYIYSTVREKNKAHDDTASYALIDAYFKINSLDAILHHNIGQVPEAIQMMEAQLLLIKDFYPGDYESKRDYQITINNLSTYYTELLDVRHAKKYALIYYNLTANQGNALDQIHALQNLGSVYNNLEYYDSAAYYWHAALDLVASTDYTNAYIHTVILNNLGGVCVETEQYNSAVYFLNKSLTIQRTKEALNPPLYQTTLYNLAEAYRWAGDYAKADRIYEDLMAGLLEDIVHNFTYLSEGEKLSFYKNQLDIIESYTAFALEISGTISLQGSDTPYINPEIPGKLYDLQLTTKAIILNASKRMKHDILNSGDSTLMHIYALWEQRKNQLAKVLIEGKTAETPLNQLKEKIEENEKWLITHSRSFRTGFQVEEVFWQEVQQTLKPGEAAVEIIRLVGGLAYGALIITHETTEQPVLSLVMSRRSKYLEKQFYKYYQNTILYKGEDTLSYPTFWQPVIDTIRSHMRGGKMPDRIYISNDGIYNQLNINTLRNPETDRYVLDETEVIIVTNTKELLLPGKVKSLAKKKAALFGAAKFSSDETNHRGFAALPGTGKEVQLIDQALSAAKWETSVFVQQEATESQLKNLHDMNVIHLASHGFFNPGGEQQGFSMAETMLRSGIALTGANDTIHYGDDGLLTAYEVIGLNLEATALVVLSACETGKGVDNYGEGVYGLQRALRVAGTENVIMSLWKVDDTATQQLMVSFYENWLKTNDMRGAFKTAQQHLRKSYPEPYYWGAFVLTGK